MVIVYKVLAIVYIIVGMVNIRIFESTTIEYGVGHMFIITGVLLSAIMYGKD